MFIGFGTEAFMLLARTGIAGAGDIEDSLEFGAVTAAVVVVVIVDEEEEDILLNIVIADDNNSAAVVDAGTLP